MSYEIKFNSYSFSTRVTYVFGGRVKYPLQEVTFTTLTTNVLSTLREVDHLANKVLQDKGEL